MREAGVELVGDAAEIHVIGLSEALTLLPRAWQLMGRLTKEAERRQPCLAVLVDAPDFHLRLGKRLKRLGIPIVYFISPQVWAWRTGRVRQIRELVKKMIVIFPFEEKFYRDAGVPVEFVGHPLAETVRARTSREEFCLKWMLFPRKPILALLPGSRKSEVKHNLPGMVEALRMLSADARTAPQAILPAAPGLGARDFEPILRNAPKVSVIENATHEAVAAADCAIVSSGTATVETALLETPMVVVYRVSSVSAMVLRRLVRTPHYSMVNLLLGRRAVPELVQEDFTAERLAAETRRLLESPEERDRMRRDLAEVRLRLASPSAAGAIGRAAQIIAAML